MGSGFRECSDHVFRCTWHKDGERCVCHPVAFLGFDRSTCYTHSWELADMRAGEHVDAKL